MKQESTAVRSLWGCLHRGHFDCQRAALREWARSALPFHGSDWQASRGRCHSGSHLLSTASHRVLWGQRPLTATGSLVALAGLSWGPGSPTPGAHPHACCRPQPQARAGGPPHTTSSLGLWAKPLPPPGRAACRPRAGPRGAQGTASHLAGGLCCPATCGSSCFQAPKATKRVTQEAEQERGFATPVTGISAAVTTHRWSQVCVAVWTPGFTCKDPRGDVGAEDGAQNHDEDSHAAHCGRATPSSRTTFFSFGCRQC